MRGYYETKPDIAKRLNRVEGQIRGIGRMVEADKNCIDILTQVSAAQAALDKIALGLLRDHARHCMKQDNAVTQRQKADELIQAFERMM